MTILFGTALVTPAQAQVMGDEAELDRLRVKAEEAMGNEDAEGAAMTMGRAALMASQLAKRQSDPAGKQTFAAAEHLARSQEHGYRGLALFRRAGGELPASAGVCGSLHLAQLELSHTQTALDSQPRPSSGPIAQRRAALEQTAGDWATFLSSMVTEFRCGE